ncbi:MAG: type IX secretion system outer membrane channel protein PorV [Bacteroidetes bacterium]|nr:type IX secretion system outer membrane channel protein PorV [Bacteroidota bacterium]
MRIHMIRKSKAFLFAVAAGLMLLSFAQDAAAQTSTAVPFLLISPSSRNSAMGEAGVAVANDVSAVFWNPAGLGFQKGMELSLNHSNWLPQFQQSDLFFEYASYKMDVPATGGTLGAALTYLNLGEFERRDEGNNPLGTFKSYEIAFTTSYGTRLDEDFALGVGLRLIHSSLSQVGTAREQGSGTATAVAGDIGVLYRPSKLDIPFSDTDIGGRFSLGAAITNIGPSISYIDESQSDPLPTALRLGFAYDIVHEKYNTLTWTTDVTKLLVSRTDRTADPFYKAVYKSWEGDNVINTFTLGTGFEYWYSQLVGLRFGFFHEDPSQGNRRFLTFGAGVRYDVYGFDFSYISTAISDDDTPSPLSETLRFTLTVNWDRGTGPADDGTRIPADDAAN